MVRIQVRDVPDGTHAVLRRRAADAGQSMQEYLLGLLNELAARPTASEVLARAAGRAGGRIGMAEAAAHLRGERERG